MAFSYNEVGPVDPGFTTVTLTFPFLERVHVSVSVDKIVLADNAWSWNSDTQIELNDPLVGGEVVKAFRTTPAAGVQADFQPGAFDYEELNTSLLHLLYIVQEAYDNSSVAVEAGNNAFSYLMQIEDLVDDAVILFGDMQGLYAAYDTQADAAMAALSLARSNALTDLANALSAALAAISTDRTAALAAITTALNTALADITSAKNTATTAVNAARDAAIVLLDDRVTTATTQAGIATTKAGEAAASAASVNLPSSPVALNYLRRNAGNTAYEQRSSSQMATDNGLVQFSQAQTLTQAEKGQALQNIGGAWEMIGAPVNLAGLTQAEWLNLSAYDQLRLRFSGRPITNGIAAIRVGSPGPGWLSVGTDYQYNIIYKTGTDAPTGSGSGGNSYLYGSISGWSASYGGHCEVSLTRFNKSQLTFYRSTIDELNASSALVTGHYGGYVNQNIAHDRLMLFGSFVSWTSGTAILEGVRG